MSRGEKILREIIVRACNLALIESDSIDFTSLNLDQSTGVCEIYTLVFDVGGGLHEFIVKSYPEDSCFDTFFGIRRSDSEPRLKDVFYTEDRTVIELMLAVWIRQGEIKSAPSIRCEVLKAEHR